MDAVEWRRRMDWFEWQRRYDRTGSPLSRRLAVVQQSILDALDRAPQGRIAVLSICAGQGRDLIGALIDHPRRTDVVGRLVEIDKRNVDVARENLERAGIDGVEAVVGDAGISDAYAGAVPADLVLVCGVFGHLSDEHAIRLIRHLPQLCAPDATVIWTRGRRPGSPFVRGLAGLARNRRWPTNRARAIPRWLERAGFEHVDARESDDHRYRVTANRYRGQGVELQPGTQLFSFIGSA